VRYTGSEGPSIDELSALKARLDTLRPFTELQIERLWPQWEAEDALFIHATNAIEGSTMTLGETTVVLESGITIGGKTIQEHLDIINGQRAYKLMLEIACSKTLIDTDVIFALHRSVVGEPEWAGKWRTEPVYIRGSMHVPPNWIKVARRMDEALERFHHSAHSEHSVVAASTLHFDLLTSICSPRSAHRSSVPRWQRPYGTPCSKSSPSRDRIRARSYRSRRKG
jgi:Fic family protein